METTQRLFRTARNQLFESVQNAELRHSDFDWDPHDVDVVGLLFHLVHRPTAFWFQGRANDLGINVSYWPGNSGSHPLERDEYQLEWVEVLAHFRTWLALVKAEHETPDLWEAAASAQTLVAVPFASTDNNQLFTTAEQARIRAALNEFREHVEAANDLTETQQREVRGRFQYLAGAVERVGRLDWFEMLVSNVVGLALGRVLDPKAMTEAMHTAHRMFGWVLTEGAKLVGGGGG